MMSSDEMGFNNAPLSSPGLTGRSSIHHHRRNKHWPPLLRLHPCALSHRLGYWVARSSRAMTPVCSSHDTGGVRAMTPVMSRDEMGFNNAPLSSPGLTGRSSTHQYRRISTGPIYCLCIPAATRMTSRLRVRSPVVAMVPMVVTPTPMPVAPASGGGANPNDGGASPNGRGGASDVPSALPAA